MSHVRNGILGVLALVLVGIQACSSEQAAAPSRPPIPPPAADGGDGVDGGGSDGGEGGTPGSCFDTTKEKPTTPAQFLNQCNGTGCFEFDNAARIEGFKPGPLPPLS